MLVAANLVRLSLALVFLISFNASAIAEVIDIDNAMLAKLLGQGVPIVDIRTAPEWDQTGIVEGSHLLTFFDSRGHYNAEAWVAEFRKIAGPDDPVILICRTGNRTPPVAGYLEIREGYERIYNVRNGIVLWIRAGRPVVQPPVVGQQ